jgi:peptide/nickel transport system substrate-binding protein
VTFAERVAAALPIIPRHVWRSIEDAPQAQSRAVLVGSGPYRLRSFSPGEGSYLFVANEHYFLGAPYIRRVELRPVDDELAALRAGEIDVARTGTEGVGADALRPFSSDDAYGIVRDPGGFTFPLIWNIGRGGALADVRFRRACALAIDRQEIVTRLIGGNGVAGNPGWLPPTHPYHSDVEQYAFDLAAANRLLDDAGYRRTSGTLRSDERGRPLRFSILTGNSPIPPVLDLVAQALKKIGVELKAQAVDLPSMFARLQSANDDMALSLYPGPGGTTVTSDPDTLRTFFSSRFADRLQGAQGWMDPEFDALASRQLVTADIDERKRLVARMQEIVARDLPALALYYPTLFTVYRREVFDRWYVTPGGFAGGLEGVTNKQVLVTGSKTGTKIRR